MSRETNETPTAITQNVETTQHYDLPLRSFRTSFETHSTPLHSNSIPFHPNNKTYSEMISPSHSLISATYNQISAPHNPNSAPYNQISAPYNHISAPRNLNSAPRNLNSAPYNPNSAAYTPISLPDDPMSIPFDPDSIPYDPDSFSTIPNSASYNPISAPPGFINSPFVIFERIVYTIQECFEIVNLKHNLRIDDCTLKEIVLYLKRYPIWGPSPMDPYGTIYINSLPPACYETTTTQAVEAKGEKSVFINIDIDGGSINCAGLYEFIMNGPNRMRASIEPVMRDMGPQAAYQRAEELKAKWMTWMKPVATRLQIEKKVFEGNVKGFHTGKSSLRKRNVWSQAGLQIVDRPRDQTDELTNWFIRNGNAEDLSRFRIINHPGDLQSHGNSLRGLVPAFPQDLNDTPISPDDAGVTAQIMQEALVDLMDQSQEQQQQQQRKRRRSTSPDYARATAQNMQSEEQQQPPQPRRRKPRAKAKKDHNQYAGRPRVYRMIDEILREKGLGNTVVNSDGNTAVNGAVANGDGSTVVNGDGNTAVNGAVVNGDGGTILNGAAVNGTSGDGTIVSGTSGNGTVANGDGGTVVNGDGNTVVNGDGNTLVNVTIANSDENTVMSGGNDPPMNGDEDPILIGGVLTGTTKDADGNTLVSARMIDSTD